jgi:polysaccharide export outer membrane protein
MASFEQKNKLGHFQLSYLLWVGLLIVSITSSKAFAEEEGYLLGGGDTVKITVYEQPDLTTIARINHLGIVIFPFLEEVAIGGLTPDAAAELISNRLKAGRFVKVPQVSLAVVEYRSHQISVLGQVKKPGKYTLESKTLVIDLLAQSGGLTNEAADVLTVVRNDPERPARYQIDLLKFYRGDVAQNIELVSGDIVLVPKMDIFYVYGEVKRPGVYRLERGMTTMQALSVGGGLTGRGSSGGISISRHRTDGKVLSIEVELTDRLQPNDVLYVKERLF